MLHPQQRREGIFSGSPLRRSEQPFARAALRMSTTEARRHSGPSSLNRVLSFRQAVLMRNLITVEMRDDQGSCPARPGRRADCRLHDHRRRGRFRPRGAACARPELGRDRPAAFLGAGLIGLATQWQRWPRSVQLIVPIGFLVLSALLRMSDGGARVRLRRPLLPRHPLARARRHTARPGPRPGRPPAGRGRPATS